MKIQTGSGKKDIPLPLSPSHLGREDFKDRFANGRKYTDTLKSILKAIFLPGAVPGSIFGCGVAPEEEVCGNGAIGDGCASGTENPPEKDPLEANGECPPDTECQGAGNIIGDLDWIDATELTDENQKRNARASGKLTVLIDGESYRCSAAIISKDLIITNHHCAPDARSAATVRFYPESESGVSSAEMFLRSFACGALVATNCAHDVSILRCLANPGTGRFPADSYGAAELELDSEYTEREQVYAIHTNCDHREDNCTPVKLLSPGVVSSYGHECITFMNEIPCGNCRSGAPQARHTCDTLGGSSGGGLFDASTHRLLGLNWGSITRPNDAGGYNFAASLAHLAGTNREFADILVPLITCNDADGDGYGTGGSKACPREEFDCNDTRAEANPGAEEVCDGRDNDCDGDIDEGLLSQCGSDTGECRKGTQACADGEWGPCADDIKPRAETCNVKDDDCDGQTDEDADPMTEASERCPDRGVCADGNAANVCSDGHWSCVYPEGHVEDECPVTDLECGFGSMDDPTCKNGIDDDCDGIADEHSQYSQCESHPDFWKVASGETCFASTIGECGQHGGEYKCVQLAGACGVSIDCVGAAFPREEGCDGKDWNCDGRAGNRGDSDYDGYGTCPGSSDCNELRPDIHPGAMEICDGLDNDCDGEIDEGGLCDDGNICTTDACGSGSGCQHTQCDDGDPCTTDTCGPFGCETQAFCWHDSATRLMWQNPAPYTTDTQAISARYCGNLTLGNYIDWRLPTIDELRSIVSGCGPTETGGACTLTDGTNDQRSRNSACDGCRPGGGQGYVRWYLRPPLSGGWNVLWSSTAARDATAIRWAIDFQKGSLSGWQDSVENMVGPRCARGTMRR